jgi:hypothetical protein
MITWKEQRLVPIIETARVLDDCENVCETCENFGELCESCNASVPITCDYEFKEVTMCQLTICGIPVGCPYEVLQ